VELAEEGKTLIGIDKCLASNSNMKAWTLENICEILCESRTMVVNIYGD
jgi:hypothetical protein